jgi:hypothetical protein
MMLNKQPYCGRKAQQLFHSCPLNFDYDFYLKIIRQLLFSRVKVAGEMYYNNHQMINRTLRNCYSKVITETFTSLIHWLLISFSKWIVPVR